VPEYAATIPEANAARSVSELGRDPDEKTTLGVKATPERLSPWMRKDAADASDTVVVPETVKMLGRARICTFQPVLVFVATPL
jgi:hypothetical protein